MIDKNFYGYEYPTKQQWIDLALRDTGKNAPADLDTLDVIEGLAIPPLITGEDVKKWAWLDGYSDRDKQGFQWQNLALVNLDRDHPAVLGTLLGQGIDGIVLKWSGEGTLVDLLKGLDSDFLTIWLQPTKQAVKALTALLAWVKEKKGNFDKFKGGLLYDPWTQHLSSTINKKEIKAVLNEIHRLTISLPGFRGLCCDAGYYHGAGGNTMQQLYYGMGALIETIDVLAEDKEDVKKVLQNLTLAAAVDGDYFFNMAKLRSFRIMLLHLAGSYGVTLSGSDLFTLASTTAWTRSVAERQNAMIRNTVEAMVAVQGKADALLVVPDEKGDVTLSSRRLAINIGHLLAEESHFVRAADALNGAYYLRFLVGTLVDRTIEEVEMLEKNGGWCSHASEGKLQSALHETLKRRQAALDEGWLTIVGENKYILSPEEKEMMK